MWTETGLKKYLLQKKLKEKCRGPTYSNDHFQGHKSAVKLHRYQRKQKLDLSREHTCHPL